MYCLPAGCALLFWFVHVSASREDGLEIGRFAVACSLEKGERRFGVEVLSLVIAR